MVFKVDNKVATILLVGLGLALVPSLAGALPDDNTARLSNALEDIGLQIGGGLAWMGFWIGLGIALTGASQR